MKKILLGLMMLTGVNTHSKRMNFPKPPPGDVMGTCECTVNVGTGPVGTSPKKFKKFHDVDVKWDVLSEKKQCTAQMCEAKAQLFARDVRKAKKARFKKRRRIQAR